MYYSNFLSEIKKDRKREYTLEFAICTKNMELLKLYSKEKTNFFLLNQVAIY